MGQPRIYLPVALSAGQVVDLTPEAATHVARVLRLRRGDPVTLFDGHGGEYEATLCSVERRRVRAELIAFHEREAESGLEITLVQGLSKGERMDFAVQKAVELGARRIVPVETEHGVVTLDAERKEKRRGHWQRVVISACEQCGRNRIPAVAPIVPLRQWLAQPPDGLGLMLDPEGTLPLSQIPPSPHVVLLIGPEGGFSDQEREQAREAGYRGIRLGPRVLRTETAAVTALAALQTLWGDLG